MRLFDFFALLAPLNVDAIATHATSSVTTGTRRNPSSRMPGVASVDENHAESAMPTAVMPLSDTRSTANAPTAPATHRSTTNIATTATAAIARKVFAVHSSAG